METELNPIIFCDSSRCVECHACEASCKAINQVEPGVKFRWVESFWQGKYPEVKNFSRSIGCYHCENAPCVEACPSGAITQDPATRVVSVDSDTCESCQTCLEVCPYGIPQFGTDGKMTKCDLCFNIRNPDESPICVMTCPAEALSLHRPDN